MSKTKCIKYQIIITYINGDEEEVQYKEGINQSSYTQMREFYKNEIKEQYKDDKNVITIEFVGVTEDKELKILWTKEINKIVKDDIVEMLGKDPRCLINKAKLIMETLKEQNKYFHDKRDMCEKRRDTLLKELLLSDNVGDIKKQRDLENRVTQKIKANEKERKAVKAYYSDIQQILREIDVDSIIDVLKPFARERNLHGCDKEKPLEYKDRVEKEVTYKTDKERIRLLKKFKNKFDKNKIDPIRKTILFYNHVGEGKRKKNKNKEK